MNSFILDWFEILHTERLWYSHGLRTKENDIWPCANTWKMIESKIPNEIVDVRTILHENKCDKKTMFFINLDVKKPGWEIPTCQMGEQFWHLSTKHFPNAEYCGPKWNKLKFSRELFHRGLSYQTRWGSSPSTIGALRLAPLWIGDI